jgi:hypothetical protein
MAHSSGSESSLRPEKQRPARVSAVVGAPAGAEPLGLDDPLSLLSSSHVVYATSFWTCLASTSLMSV